MTRLAYDLGGWTEQPFAGTAADGRRGRPRGRYLRQRPAVGPTSAADQPRPAPDRAQVLRLHRRRHRPVHDRRGPRQVMLSARELALEQNPKATGWVNQRIIFTHGVGVAMVPVNEAGSEGQPNLLISNLPPASSGGAPAIDPAHAGSISANARARTSSSVRSRTSSTTRPARATRRARSATETRWTGTTGVELDNTLMRLLFAARFRDLDLLISNQVTPTASSSSTAPSPTGCGWSRRSCTSTRIRTSSSTRPAGWSTSRTRSRRPTGSRTPSRSTRRPDSTSAATRSTTSATASRSRSTPTTARCTSTSATRRPDHPRLRGRLPVAVRAALGDAGRHAAHLRVPEDLFNVQTRMFGRYHVTNTLQFFRADDLWTVPIQIERADAPVAGVLRRDAAAGRDGVEFLLLQPMVPTSRPNMIAWVAARMDGANYGQVQVYRFPADTTIFGAGPDRGADRPGSGHQRPGLALEPVGEQGHPRQPDRRAARRRPDLPPADLPAVDRVGVPGVHPDRGGLATPGGLVRHPWRRVTTPAGRRGRLADPDPQPDARGRSPGPGAPSPTPGPGSSPTATPPSGLPSDVPGLDRLRQRPFRAGPAALRDGDFARYGQEIALVQAALQRLQVLAPGLAIPSPGASTSPAP